MITFGFIVIILVKSQRHKENKYLSGKTKALDPTKFEEDFNASSLPSILSLDGVVDAVAAYNHCILDLCDRDAPIVTTLSASIQSPHGSMRTLS